LLEVLFIAVIMVNSKFNLTVMAKQG
jgi:hypothetical protein